MVYLDEVDSVLSSRENGDDSSHGTLTSVKTTLMQEWDGLRTTKDRVVVIASTNRYLHYTALHVQALVRPHYVMREREIK